jgi:uncharacterized metal-binding protein YceD (DUF177 family)
LSNEFYINHAELPEEGREVKVNRSADWLSEILRDDVYVVRGDTTITGLIRPVGENVSIELKAQVPLVYHCSRCGRENNFVYDTGIKHFFTTSQSNKLELPIEVARHLDAELDITEVNSRKFDAEPTIVEAFAGELSTYPTCLELCEEAVVSNLEPESEPESVSDAQIDPRLAPLMAIREAMESGPSEAKA